VTAEEIKHTEEFARTHAGWLKEIAYQLAVMNQPAFKREEGEQIMKTLEQGRQRARNHK
jgi:hypothetical protein